MEGLVRLVSESLERHGIAVPPAPIEWSAWMPLDSNLCLTAPCHPGLFVVAEGMVAHTVSPNPAVQLVILKIGQTTDLGVEMARLCFHSPLRDRIRSGRCLVRFAVVADEAQRVHSCATLQQWFTHSLETSTDSRFPVDLAANPSSISPAISAEPLLASPAHQPTRNQPAPLPSGF